MHSQAAPSSAGAVEAVRHVLRRAIETDTIAARHRGPIARSDKWAGELILAVEGAVAAVAHTVAPCGRVDAMPIPARRGAVHDTSAPEETAI